MKTIKSASYMINEIEKTRVMKDKIYNIISSNNKIEVDKIIVLWNKYFYDMWNLYSNGCMMKIIDYGEDANEVSKLINLEFVDLFYLQNKINEILLINQNEIDFFFNTYLYPIFSHDKQEEYIHNSLLFLESSGHELEIKYRNEIEKINENIRKFTMSLKESETNKYQFQELIVRFDFLKSILITMKSNNILEAKLRGYDSLIEYLLKKAQVNFTEFMIEMKLVEKRLVNSNYSNNKYVVKKENYVLEDFLKTISDEMKPYSWELSCFIKDFPLSNIINLSELNINMNPQTIFFPKDDESIIIIKSFSGRNDMYTLVHELGHAYSNYLLKKIIGKGVLTDQNEYRKEFIPLLLESICSKVLYNDFEFDMKYKRLLFNFKYELDIIQKTESKTECKTEKINKQPQNISSNILVDKEEIKMILKEYPKIVNRQIYLASKPLNYLVYILNLNYVFKCFDLESSHPDLFKKNFDDLLNQSLKMSPDDFKNYLLEMRKKNE